jgi:hypothetical protein
MITVPTVFVLGAGASAPYGLPLGIQLRLDIFKNYTMDTDRSVHLFNTTKFRRPDIDKFVDALRYSGLLSVDAFLERRPEFMEIGKSMMGVELLHGEVHDRLWQDGSNWLTYLYSSMVGNSLDEFLNNKVSLVTFNYDRSVEHFLYISLKNSFGRSSQDTAGAMRSIPIVHLHGRLGYLPWQGGNNGISFGDNQIDGRKMDILQKEIKVVHEELTDGRDKDFDEAKALLH